MSCSKIDHSQDDSYKKEHIISYAKEFSLKKAPSLSFISFRNTKSHINNNLETDWDASEVFIYKRTANVEVPVIGYEDKMISVKKFSGGNMVSDNMLHSTTRLIVRRDSCGNYSQFIVTRIWEDVVPDITGATIDGIDKNSLTLIYTTDGEILSSFNSIGGLPFLLEYFNKNDNLPSCYTEIELNGVAHKFYSFDVTAVNKNTISTRGIDIGTVYVESAKEKGLIIYQLVHMAMAIGRDKMHPDSQFLFTNYSPSHNNAIYACTLYDLILSDFCRDNRFSRFSPFKLSFFERSLMLSPISVAVDLINLPLFDFNSDKIILISFFTFIQKEGGDIAFEYWKRACCCTDNNTGSGGTGGTGGTGGSIGDGSGDGNDSIDGSCVDEKCPLCKKCLNPTKDNCRRCFCYCDHIICEGCEKPILYNKSPLTRSSSYSCEANHIFCKCLWWTNQHNTITKLGLDEILNEDQFKQIQKGQEIVDKMQEVGDSPKHAMRMPDQTIKEAMQAMKEHFCKTAKYFIQNDNYQNFGEAIHPIQDAYSPAHDFNVWTGKNVLPHLFENIFTSPDLAIDAANATKSIYHKLIALGKGATQKQIEAVFDTWKNGFENNNNY